MLISDSSSNWRELSSGMLHGSGLDPPPFNSFVNDLDEEMTFLKINCVDFKIATEKGMEKGKRTQKYIHYQKYKCLNE